MNAAEVVNQAAAAGVRIAVNGSDLSLEATEAPPNAILELISQHKPEIIALLSAAEAQVTWLDMVVAVENEAGRHRIWRDELTRQAADDKLTAIERDTLQRAIASRARQKAIFDAVLRVIEHARADGHGAWDE